MAIGFRLLVALVSGLFGLGGTPAVAESPAWHPPINTQPANRVLLSDKGVRPGGAEDVSAGINAALASLRPGQTLYLQAGTYRIASTLLIHSQTALQGPQGPNGEPLTVLEQTKPFGQWGPVVLGLLMNQNYTESEIADHDIRVTAIAFRDNSAGVLLRRVQNVVVEGSRFTGGGDGTAFIGSKDTRVSHCIVTGTRNAAFDHWGGAENATVEDSIADVQRGHGIIFNGAGTSYEPMTSQNFIAARNIITGIGKDAVGIWVSPLGNGTSRIAGTITIADNIVRDPQQGVRAGGIFVNASGANIIVERNSVSGFIGYSPIAVGPNRQQEGASDQLPDQVIVKDNTINNNRASRTMGGIVKLVGRHIEATGNRMAQNRFEDGSAAPAVNAYGMKCGGLNSGPDEVTVNCSRQ